MKHFRIGEFANKAGVTVRTIRYYDRIGLLRPSARSESQQRLYTELDFARLQQILTLKLIGLSLEEIKSLLTSELGGIHHLLERQKRVLQAKAQQLLTVIQTIEKAQGVLSASPKLDVEQFVNIIKAVNMNNQSDWFSQFMTEEQQEHLVAFTNSQTFEDQKQAGQAWKTLFNDIRANMDKDVNSLEVQQLVERWEALIDQFDSSGSDFLTRLTIAYGHINGALDHESVPVELAKWTQGIQDAANFIQKGRKARE